MTTRRAIDARELDAATRARLGLGGAVGDEGISRQAMGEHLQEQRRARDEQAIAKQRVHTGKRFETALAMTHRQYEFLKWGKIWPHATPFVRVKGQWIPRAGGGPVDYTGHVHIARDGAVIRGARLRAPEVRTIPVAFDAKVLGSDHATYHHEKKRQHQLHALRDASAAGVCAFLLVLAPQLDAPAGRVFAIDVAAHFVDLLRPHGLKLFERSSPKAEPFLHLPSIAPATTTIAGWDWIPLLDWVTNGGA